MRDTKERILYAAQEVFAEHGFSTPSLRDVTAAAGVNVAAVNYHFGSKEVLLRSVIGSVFAPINSMQRHHLDTLLQQKETPSVEELLAAFLFPIFDLFGDDRGRVLARLVGQIMADQNDTIRHMVVDTVAPVEHAYVQAFHAALPYIPMPELWWRFRSMIGVLVAHLSGLVRDPRASEPGNDAASRAWIITFLAAAFRAPATSIPSPAEATQL
jgi:AcrR family transcriptional regulator